MVRIKDRELLIGKERYRLFAGEIHYWRIRPKYWEKVLVGAKEAGFKIVSTYVPWRIHCLSKGNYEFQGEYSSRTDLVKFLQLCNNLDLKVIIRPGPLVDTELQYGGFPDWLFDDPDMLAWDCRNRVPEGLFGVGSPCYLHPLYLEYVKGWLGAVDKAIRKFTAVKGGPVIIVQLDNEISHCFSDSMFESDYNPVIVGRGGYYQQWLKEKYIDIKKIPYRKAVDSFEEILPPRELKISSENDLPYYWDWVEFKEWMYAEYLKRLREIHERNGVTDILFMINLPNHSPIGVPQNWKLLKEIGLLGSDFYRKPSMNPIEYYSMVIEIKVADALIDIPFSAEFQCGTVGDKPRWSSEEHWKMGAIPAEHTKYMSLLAIAHGLKGLNYYMFVEREKHIYSAISEMGHRRSSFSAIAQVMEFVNGIQDLGKLRRSSEVAVMYYRPYARLTYFNAKQYPPPSRQFLEVEEAKKPDPGKVIPTVEGRLDVTQPLINGEEVSRIYLEFEGMISLFLQAGFDPGIVDPWVNPEAMNKFKAIFVPAGPFMDEKTLESLLKYVQNGGKIIIGPHLPSKTLDMHQTKILTQYIAETDWILTNEIELDSQIGKVSGKSLLISGNGEPLGLPGNNFVSSKKIGKGEIVHLGTYLSQITFGEEPEENIKFLQRLLARWQIFPLIESGNRFVNALIQKNEKEEYLFLVNNNYRPQEVKLTFRDKKVKKLVSYWEKKQINVEKNMAEVSLDSKSVEVFNICAHTEKVSP